MQTIRALTYILCGLLTFLLMSAVSAASTLTETNGFVGASVCQGCHTAQYEMWQTSHHRHAMAAVSPDTVRGDFSNVTVTFQGHKSRFFRQDDEYFVETMGSDGELATFEIEYTFGYEPLQQYLVRLKDGHIQALNIAWDTRPKHDGGQRWFNLQPDEPISPDNPFFWTRHFQNWNSRCADCHSTNVKRNYLASAHAFETNFSEINVACEACHGPGEAHVALVKAGQPGNSHHGFKPIRAPLDWQFKNNAAIASAIGGPDETLVNMCGRCHSLRNQLSQDKTAPFHEANAIALIQAPNYFPDGQIREEVFVLGSFLQSKMFEAGVTCTDCHEPHSARLVMEGNALCGQCHKPEVFDAPQHHGQKAEIAPACVDCHMPSRTYMQVDDRRDHSFVVPGQSMIHDRDFDLLPPILKASQLAGIEFDATPLNEPRLQASFESEDPLVRRGAVMAAANLPANQRWQLLAPLIEDASRPVRFEVARALSELYPLLPTTEARQHLWVLLKEYRETLKVTADSPASQLALATLDMYLGNTQAAEDAFLHSLRIEPGYVPTLLNLAEFYRSTGRAEKSSPLIQQALQIAPDNAAANHSRGLDLVRQRDYAAALPYLNKAANLESATPRFAFVYAVALENQGQMSPAIEVLEKSLLRWPDQYPLLLTLTQYLIRSGQLDHARPYADRLLAIAPDSPEVQQLIRHLRPSR